jgi:hypothetical protein
VRPIEVITALVLGSAAAISFGLITSLIVFLVLQGRHPQFAAELHPLAISSLLFVMLSAVSGVALYGTLKRVPWWLLAQLAMWVAVAGVGFVSWPR